MLDIANLGTLVLKGANKLHRSQENFWLACSMTFVWVTMAIVFLFVNFPPNAGFWTPTLLIKEHMLQGKQYSSTNVMAKSTLDLDQDKFTD